VSLSAFTLESLLMEVFMKRIFLLLTVLISGSGWAQTINWNDSPNNWNNSLNNYDNSPLNYNNSPLNYNNSPLNYSSSNGVYDNSGNRIGYQTQSPTGVTNVYDNSGNRIGYSPAGSR